MKMFKLGTKTVLAVFFIVGLVGCGSSAGKTAMTNDEIIEQVQKCKDSILEPVPSYIWGGPRIFAITCTPRKERAN